MLNTEQETKFEAIQKDVITKIRKVLDEMITARESLNNVLLGEGYIVMIGGLSCKFVREKDGIGTKVHTCFPHTASRYTKESAERIAKSVRNGKGEKGFAIHVRDALDKDIIIQQNLLNELTGVEPIHG